MLGDANCAAGTAWPENRFTEGGRLDGTWMNKDSRAHSVVADGGVFNSGTIGA